MSKDLNEVFSRFFLVAIFSIPRNYSARVREGALAIVKLGKVVYEFRNPLLKSFALRTPLSVVNFIIWLDVVDPMQCKLTILVEGETSIALLPTFDFPSFTLQKRY